MAATSMASYAQVPGLRLEVRGDAEGCVTRESLEARIRRFLVVHRPIELDVAVRTNAVPVVFEVRRGGAVAAERRFDVLPVGCDARIDALALAISVAVEHAVGPEHVTLDVEGAGAAPAEPAATQPAGDAAPPVAKTVPPVPVVAPPDEADKDDTSSDEPDASGSTLDLGLAVFAGAGALIDAVPEPAFVVHAGGELGLGPLFSASIAALFAPGVDVDLAGARAPTSLLGGRLLGCLGTEPGAVRIEGCLGAAAGAVWSSGKGAALDSAADATMGWGAGVLRAAVSVPADGPLGVRLALDGHLNVLRPELRVAGTIPDRRLAGPVGAAGSLEVWFELP